MDNSELENRVAALERANRRLRRRQTGIVLAAGVALVAAFGLDVRVPVVKARESQATSIAQLMVRIEQLERTLKDVVSVRVELDNLRSTDRSVQQTQAQLLNKTEVLEKSLGDIRPDVAKLRSGHTVLENRIEALERNRRRGR